MDAQAGTAQDKLTALFDELGIGYKVKQADRGREAPTIVRIKEGYKGAAGRVDGYGRFYVDFGFNDDGSFRDVGVWE